MSQSLTIGFIGFGLIGGSIAHALRKSVNRYQIIAYNYYDKPNQSLLAAKEDGVVDFIAEDLCSCFADCDIIFLCAPVLENIHYLQQLKGCIKDTCLITDVGSVKGNISQAVEELGLAKNFVGGHPMAGSERTGYHNSSSLLLENAYYILAPTAETPAFMMERMLQIVADVHAIPVTLDCRQHDDVVAAISHLPHIVASSLVNLIRSKDNDSSQMLTLAAGGFKDITRIASSSPVMWQNICLTNQESILKFLSYYEESLREISIAIKNQDEAAIYEYFETAKNYRDSVPDSKGGILARSYELYLEVADEAGVIASIATLLAGHAISIKNIGIIHNREFADGVLRMELYDQESLEKSRELLKQRSYTIYER